MGDVSTITERLTHQQIKYAGEMNSARPAPVLWTQYKSMRHRLAGVVTRELAEETGLSEPEFEILARLDDEPSGTLRAMSLRCAVGWEKSRLSHQIRRMEERGYVRREACVTDSRSAVVVLTEAGKSVIAAARPVQERIVSEHFLSVLSQDQQEALSQACGAVLSHLEKLDTTVHSAARTSFAVEP